MTREGKAVTGTLTAASRPDAVTLLAERGSFVTDIDEQHNRQNGDTPTGNTDASAGGLAPAAAVTASDSGRASAETSGSGSGGISGEHSGGAVSFFGRRRVKPRQRAAMFRQLAVALEAGLNLLPALQIVRDQAESPALAALADSLADRVQQGESLSGAMRSHGKEFTPMHVGMVKAGETAGVLDQVMNSLAGFTERDVDIREKLRSAAIYPLMVLTLGLISIVIILVFILPNILAAIGTDTPDLPLPTVIMMTLSDALRSPGGIVAALLLLAGGVALFNWSKTPEGALAFDTWKLRAPLLGNAVRRVAVARFARTLGTLTGSGIQIVPALRIVRDTLGNEVLARQIDLATEQIVRGHGVADTLRQSGDFPQLLIQVIAMGERTGKLDALLLRSADTYDKETDAALGRVMSILPALLIVVLAVFVAFILAAALLPIMTLDMGA